VAVAINIKAPAAYYSSSASYSEFQIPLFLLISLLRRSQRQHVFLQRAAFNTGVDMAEKSSLRRLKRLLPAFAAIDAAIEAATGFSRDNIRQERGKLVEMLCDIITDNDSVELAEGLCQLLDEAMVFALKRLRVVEATPTVLATTDAIKAVAGLRSHESGRVRGLACSIIGGWTTSINCDISTGRAILVKLSKMQQAHKALRVPGRRH
jgi:hypothetical protein